MCGGYDNFLQTGCTDGLIGVQQEGKFTLTVLHVENRGIVIRGVRIGSVVSVTERATTHRIVRWDGWVATGEATLEEEGIQGEVR